MIPVTVIGGYLGAGKTTLINRLLHGDHGRRVTVLVNDFGAINIDADLIASHDGDTISLSNGCVCCSIVDALGDALDKVLQSQPLPEQIVIEASGVADPAKIAVYGQGWPGVRLDAVVTVADGETIQARSNDKFVGGLVRKQIASGDLIILSKVDLLDEQNRNQVRDWVSAEVAGAEIVEAVEGDVPATLLLEQGGTRWPEFGTDEEIHDHVEIFAAMTFEDQHPFDKDRLGALLDRWPTSVWRAKGLVFLSAYPDHAYFLQRVGKRWSLEAKNEWGDLSPQNKLAIVGIKTAFDKQKLRRDLIAAQVQ